MKDFANSWISDFAPMAVEKLEKNKENALMCQIIWNGDTWFEIKEGEYGHTV